MKIKIHKDFDGLLSMAYDFQTRELYDGYYGIQTENVKGLNLNLGISIY